MLRRWGCWPSDCQKVVVWSSRSYSTPFPCLAEESAQTAYSLANLRAGNFPTARKENKKLIKKASKFDKITELKQLHLHRALIEAHDGKEKEAKKYLATALEMNSTAALDLNSQKLVKETERALAKLKK